MPREMIKLHNSQISSYLVKNRISVCGIMKLLRRRSPSLTSLFISCFFIAVVIQPIQAKQVTEIQSVQELNRSAKTVKKQFTLWYFLGTSIPYFLHLCRACTVNFIYHWLCDVEASLSDKISYRIS